MVKRKQLNLGSSGRCQHGFRERRGRTETRGEYWRAAPAPQETGLPLSPGGRWGAPSKWVSVCLALVCLKDALAPHQHGPQWEEPYPSCCWLESRLCASGSHAPKTDNSEAVNTWATCWIPSLVWGGGVEGIQAGASSQTAGQAHSNRASNPLTHTPHLALHPEK